MLVFSLLLFSSHSCFLVSYSGSRRSDPFQASSLESYFLSYIVYPSYFFLHRQSGALLRGIPVFYIHTRQNYEKTRPDTRHKMRLVCVLFTFEINTGRTCGPTDGHDLLYRCVGASKNKGPERLDDASIHKLCLPYFFNESNYSLRFKFDLQGLFPNYQIEASFELIYFFRSPHPPFAFLLLSQLSVAFCM